MTKGAFHTGEYRNIFSEVGFTAEEIENKIKNTWDDIFSQESENKIYFEEGSDLGYLVDTGNNDVRSEGQSYGMMAAVQMDEKEIFDRIWNWSHTYMLMREGENKGYFAWHCELDGTKIDHGPAPDGEEFFAMALFLASNRWGDGEGPYDYSNQAREILSTCLHKGENGEPGDPMWEKENYLIKFIPNVDFSDPSYHLPHFYETFSLYANEEDRDFWKKAATASREYLEISCHPETGMAPEYAHYDGTPNHIRGFGDFYSDSYRVAMNIGQDYEWFRNSKTPTHHVQNLLEFFEDISIEDYTKYTIEGEPLEADYVHNVGLIAANAMGTLAIDDDELKEKTVRKFWDIPLREDGRRYYDNFLYLFSVLALSGNYRSW